MSKFKVMGINDDVTTCECCGKSNLKMTVVLSDGERELAYGRDCAARALRPMLCGRPIGKPMTALKVQRMAEQAEHDRERAGRRKTMLAVPNF